MRRAVPIFLLGLAALELISVAGNAQLVPDPPPSPPPSLKTVPVPQGNNLSDFVKDKSAAIALGKALFWDMQVGSDGEVACATCHFQAGADSRTRNQVNAGSSGGFEVGGPNHAFVSSDFPFHELVDPDNRSSARIRSKNDVGGSQGVHGTMFQDVVVGSAQDQVIAGSPDPLGFMVGGLNVRRVTGRNTPPAINAVFNVRNFWDGRANRRFNGRNPFGDDDPNARVFRVNDLGEPELVRISVDRASLASQAVGPPLSDVEMSAGNRTWLKLGKKMVPLQPLASQRVHPDDSVLGALAVSGADGLATTYADMIRAAFHEKWWNSSAVVDAGLNVIPGLTAPADGSGLTTDQYTVMEANFSMFWGFAILAYEATLVSDDAPYDRFAEGESSALSPQQKFGMKLFFGSSTGNCAACHAGSEFTGASFSARLDPTTPDGMIERMIMGDKHEAIYDGGFYNIGVRPTADDIGLGASDPFGNPLSLARREQQHPGSVQDNKIGPVGASERIAADGAFKTPSLRNVELTGPYFHNGSVARLSDVVQFYTRGGNFHDENLRDLDADIHRVKGLIGRPMRKLALTNFMRALTDERVRWFRAPFDHPELDVQDGAQGSEVSVLADLAVPGQAEDQVLHLPPVGRYGSAAPLQPFLGLPSFDGAPIPAPNPVFSHLAVFATDTLIVNSRVDSEGDLWSNGVVRLRGKKAWHLKGDVVAGGDLNVPGDTTTIDGSLMARGNVNLSSTSTVVNGFVGSRVEYYAPLQMPEAPMVAGGSSKITVPMGGTMNLAPGRYGALYVQKNSTLVLGAGEYVFKGGVYLSNNALIRYDGGGSDPVLGPEDEMSMEPTERTFMHVIGDVSLNAGAAITAGSAEKSNRFRMYVRNAVKPIYISAGGLFHGTLIAPGASIYMGQGSSFAGALFGRIVELADRVAFRPHKLDELEGEPLAPAPLAAMAAGEGDAITVGSPLAMEFALAQNTPNPFKPQTLIRFSLPEEQEVQLSVFDVTGRRVRTLAQGTLGAGVHTLAWNGHSDAGTRLPAGVYLYRLKSGGQQLQRKMILVD